MLNLDTGVDFDEVVPSHLVDQKLSSASIPVTDALCQLDRICKDSPADLLRKVSGRSDLNNLLVATLDGTVTLKEVNSVAHGVSEDLDLDVARALKEPLNEDGAITKSRLGL